MYQSTPHSGGYYHISESYWANGAPNVLGNNIVGLPAITYSVDGKGRVYSGTASSSQNPLSSTTYNVAGLPTAVNLGSGDRDAFTYDPNTDRMTQYQFTVNSQSVTGTLTWNALGTLAKLVITDPFNSSNAQTCNYSHDDLVRIASANCGSAASQTFSYDAFGNINKSGSPYSFNPSYSSATNHMTQIGSSTPTYDANGSVTNDFLHTYSWDANGRPVTADSVGLTYDALGRMVEQNNAGTYMQIVWSPTGWKLAYMNGQTLEQGNFSLPAGAVVAYNSSGLLNYHHADWLGSYRLASTPNRTVYWDGAYAPFGEPYAQSGGPVDLSFTGMNQDTVPNLYDFPAREYGIQGRWPSPDPAGLSAADPSAPQSWNRYAYVNNNPLADTDPTGMDSNENDGNDSSAFDVPGITVEGLSGLPMPSVPSSPNPGLDISGGDNGYGGFADASQSSASSIFPGMSALSYVPGGGMTGVTSGPVNPGSAKMGTSSLGAATATPCTTVPCSPPPATVNTDPVAYLNNFTTKTYYGPAGTIGPIPAPGVGTITANVGTTGPSYFSVPNPLSGFGSFVNKCIAKAKKAGVTGSSATAGDVFDACMAGQGILKF